MGPAMSSAQGREASHRSREAPSNTALGTIMNDATSSCRGRVGVANVIAFHAANSAASPMVTIAATRKPRCRHVIAATIADISAASTRNEASGPIVGMFIARILAQRLSLWLHATEGVVAV